MRIYGTLHPSIHPSIICRTQALGCTALHDCALCAVLRSAKCPSISLTSPWSARPCMHLTQVLSLGSTVALRTSTCALRCASARQPCGFRPLFSLFPFLAFRLPGCASGSVLRAALSPRNALKFRLTSARRRRPCAGNAQTMFSTGSVCCMHAYSVYTLHVYIHTNSTRKLSFGSLTFTAHGAGCPTDDAALGEESKRQFRPPSVVYAHARPFCPRPFPPRTPPIVVPCPAHV